jgi:hypothetical protein
VSQVAKGLTGEEKADDDLAAAVVLGGFILFCLGIGVFGFCQGLGKGNGKKDVGLIVFNWCLIATS